ncbi:MAG TPA: CHAT domain-containing protein, partial [Longimicrobiaceae bacterium]|nr:CHAT domain-containing protein [Longimicrobiaceae bacterium]
VAAERAYFAGLAARGVAVTRVPATALEVQQALAGGTYDGVHFSGHGAFRDANPDRSALLLENGGSLSPEALSGRLRNLGKAAPLVFLNACQVGRGGRSLVDVGGFARRFVGAGAAAFVGAYWSVFDAAAGAFSTALYDRLLAGEPFGAAALRARQAVRAEGDPTWLAYTVYADPFARVA